MTSSPPSYPRVQPRDPPCLCVQVDSFLGGRAGTSLLPGSFFFAMRKYTVINDELKDWVAERIGGAIAKERFYIATRLRDGLWMQCGRETLNQLTTNQPLMTTEGMVQFRVLPVEVRTTEKYFTRWIVNGDEVEAKCNRGDWWL